MSLIQELDNCISIVQAALKRSATNVKPKYNFKYLVVLDFEATCDDKHKRNSNPLKLSNGQQLL